MATQSFFFSLKFHLSTALLFLCLFVSSLNKGCANEEGDTTDSHHHHHHTHIVQVTSLLPAAVCKPSTKGTHNKRASLKVVHKHGPCSPLGQNAPNLTQILLQDQGRVDSIHSRLSKSSPKDNFYTLETTVPAKDGSVVSSGNYIVTVGLGTPARQLSLIFDTGSDLTWTQCQPCVKYCHDQKETIFDPSKSKSYTNISCNSALCSQLVSATGNTPGCSSSTCIYGIQYGDKSYSVGFFGKEKLTLTSSDSFDNLLFGCGQNNQGLFGQSAGLLGLGRDKISFVSQSAQKYGRVFSYCIPSSSSSTGYLSFGKGSTSSRNIKFTPLLSDSQNPSFYFMDIIGISVGGKKLSISTSVFSTAGSLIDSGTVITRLPPTAYTALRSAFRQVMLNYPMAQALSILDTCYDLSQYKTVTIPKISFYFNGGAEMDLDFSGILYVASSSQVCLAVAGNSDDSDFAIFGNVQQKTFDVVYDVAGGKLGFGPGGCD